MREYLVREPSDHCGHFSAAVHLAASQRIGGTAMPRSDRPVSWTAVAGAGARPSVATAAASSQEPDNPVLADTVNPS